MTKLEQKLIELGYEEAQYEKDNRITFFKNKYGCFDLYIILSKDRNSIDYSDVSSPHLDTPRFWLSKLRICQAELEKDLGVLKNVK